MAFSGAYLDTHNQCLVICRLAIKERFTIRSLPQQHFCYILEINLNQRQCCLRNIWTLKRSDCMQGLIPSPSNSFWTVTEQKYKTLKGLMPEICGLTWPKALSSPTPNELQSPTCQPALIPTQTSQPPLIGPLLPRYSTCSRDWAISNPSLTPKAFTARKISLSSSKASPGAGNTEGEVESGGAAGRKRRWGSSTSVTSKKPSISITTDSLKSLIPDIRPCPGQEAVVDLHPEEAHLSGGEEDSRELPDQELKIRRTVTQVVPSESQENGQKESKRSRREDEERGDGGELKAERDRGKSHEEKMNSLFPGAMETQSPSPPGHDLDMDTVTPGDTLIRRSISQQKSGVSVTIDDPVRTARQASPPRGKVSNIVHVSNLVRPFTLGQLKELLGRTGTVLDDGFWIDKIKSHCYVTYPSPEEAVATRAALHGVKWPQSNPKFLNVDFSQQEELDFHRGLSTDEKPGDEAAAGPGRGRPAGPAPLLPGGDQWAEREREMERRERARAEREWDRDKVKPGEEREGGPRRSRSRERKRKESGKSKEKKADKKEKAAEEPPAKMLDDLFCKTKAAPCIYWLPLTDEQFALREAARAERVKERERKRKELQDEEDKKKEEERKERMKAGGGTGGDRGEGERGDRDRDRGRDREGDKRREAGYRRPGGSSAGGGRRSRSRSDPPPRDRRR